MSRILDSLHSQADTVDPPLLDQIGDKTDDEMAHVLDHAFIPASPDAGRFLYTLVRATKGGTVVEFGASLGISTIYLAAAVGDRGEGSVITTELHPGKAQRARENLRAASPISPTCGIRITDTSLWRFRSAIAWSSPLLQLW